MKYIYQVKEANPDALITMDIVSSVPYVDIDFSKIDLTFFSVQKGFGLPAGLAVMIVSPRALEKAQEVEVTDSDMTTYRKFSVMKKYADKFQTFETPNVFGLYLFSGVIDDMLSKGINAIRTETEQKASYLYSFFLESIRYSLPDIAEEFRSKTVVVAGVEGGSAGLLTKLKEQGIVVGAGYEAAKDEQIRIANFPALSIEDTQNLIRLL
jgi:phosphoserine aminotransferase